MDDGQKLIKRRKMGYFYIKFSLVRFFKFKEFSYLRFMD